MKEHPALYGDVATIVDVGSSVLPAPLVLPSTVPGTERLRQRRLDADSRRRQVAAALHGASITEMDENESGQLAVRQYRLRSGGLLDVDGRPLRPDFLAAPDRTSRSMASCGTAYALRYAPESDTWFEHPISCNSIMCAVCMRRRAAESVGDWLEPVLALHRRGHQVLHLTLTQPTKEGDEEVHLTRFERATLPYDGAVAEPTARARSTPGESLSASVDRLTAALRGLRSGSQSNRRFWRSTVLAGLYSIESTGQTIRDSRVVLRWHTHVHMLLIVPRDTVTRVDVHKGRSFVRTSDPWLADLLTRWCALTGADVSGQHCELVSATDRVRGAVTEVLKYPGKLSQLTDAQKLEWVASMKGRRLRAMPLGAFHASSNHHKLAVWLASGEQTPRLRVRMLRRQAKEVPEQLQRAHDRLVSTQAGRRLFLSVISYACCLMSTSDDDDEEEPRPVYVSHPDDGPVVLPGHGRVALLTRRNVCESMLAGGPLRLLLPTAPDTWVPRTVDPHAILSQLLRAAVPESEYRDDPLPLHQMTLTPVGKPDGYPGALYASRPASQSTEHPGPANRAP